MPGSPAELLVLLRPAPRVLPFWSAIQLNRSVVGGGAVAGTTGACTAVARLFDNVRDIVGWRSGLTEKK